MKKTLTASALVFAAFAGAASASSWGQSGAYAQLNPGDVQLAYSAGVEPGAYTRSEMIQIIEAKRENETGQVAYILSGENRKAPNPAYVVTPGEEQLARAIGVDAADHTLAELVALQPHDHNDNN